MASETKFKETEIGMIPEDWEISRLEEIALKVTDGSHFSPKESCNGSRIICTVKDMEYNKFSLKDAKHISEEDFDSLVKNGCSPEIGDILISKDGANCLDLIFVYNQEEEIVLLSSIAIVKLKKSFNPYFYRYYLLSPQAQKLMRNGYVSGSAIPRVILKDFKKLPVPVPPKSEIQDKIADIMWSLDQKIELNRQINATLEQITQTLFKHWFIDFEFPDENKNPYKSSGGRMVDSKLGEIPEGWEVIENISEICTKIDYGYTQSACNEAIGPKFLRVTDINKGDWIEWNNVPYCKIEESKLSKYILQKGDIVVARMADPGKLEIIDSDINAIFASYLIRIRLTDVMYSYYLYYLMKSKYYQNFILGSSSGSVQKNVNAKGLTNGLPIAIPDKIVVYKFNTIIEDIRHKINMNLILNQKLSNIRDSLLPKLMSGKIRVEC